jgi:hypothetical protein
MTSVVINSIRKQRNVSRTPTSLPAALLQGSSTSPPATLAHSYTPIVQLDHLLVSAFRPRGVPGPTSKLSPRVPAQMGLRETEHEGGKRRQARKGKLVPFVLSCTQVGCACSRGLQASAWERARALYALARPPAWPTFPYESPGPSFCGRCSSVLTCLAERS